MPTLTPIKTVYHHHRFASRLEARWAVCFDALGIPWEYEPEGYLLENGPYLPDFRLWGCLHVEVKPAHRPDEGPAFYEALIERTRGMDQLLVLVGLPRVVWYPVITVAPYALMWIDLDRSSLQRRPHLVYADRRPDPELLAWPHFRFERAAQAASFERFDRPSRRIA